MQLALQHRGELGAMSKYLVDELDQILSVLNESWNEGHADSDQHVVDLKSGGYIRQGQTGFNVGTGFWLGDEGGTPKLSIGSPTGGRLTWDGATLAIAGSVTVEGYVEEGAAAADVNGNSTKIDGGKISAASLAAIVATLGSCEIGSGGALRQGQTGFDNGTGFWLGDDGGTPKFSIGNSGGKKLVWNGSSLTLVADTLDVANVNLSSWGVKIFVGDRDGHAYSFFDGSTEKASMWWQGTGIEFWIGSSCYEFEPNEFRSQHATTRALGSQSYPWTDLYATLPEGGDQFVTWDNTTGRFYYHDAGYTGTLSAGAGKYISAIVCDKGLVQDIETGDLPVI